MIFCKLNSISSEKEHSKKLNIQHVNNKITGNAFFSYILDLFDF